MKHGDQALCRRCWEVVTLKADRANPYWEHPNRWPYCWDTHDPDAEPGPADPVDDWG